MNTEKSEPNVENNKVVNNEKLVGMLFMGSITGASLLFGFSTALSMAKKRDANAFNRGISVLSNAQQSESGGSLAMRALGWATLYACSGFSLFCFTVWKALGVNDLQEFRLKVGNLLPRITRDEDNKSRTQFSSLTDLLQYIIEESDKSQKNNNNNNNNNNDKND